MHYVQLNQPEKNRLDYQYIVFFSFLFYQSTFTLKRQKIQTISIQGISESICLNRKFIVNKGVCPKRISLGVQCKNSRLSTAARGRCWWWRQNGRPSAGYAHPGAGRSRQALPGARTPSWLGDLPPCPVIMDKQHQVSQAYNLVLKVTTVSW